MPNGPAPAAMCAQSGYIRKRKDHKYGKKAEKYLVIVESPAKAKTIGKYLGPAYQVKACMGHLRDLPKSKLGVDVENDFEPNYRPIKGKEDIIRDLKQAAKESDAVYLATDPDREGEAISWHLKQLLDLPEDRTFRVTFNEITRKVVTESIRQPGTLTRTWWTPSRPGVSWTASWAMSCPRCCGKRSAGASPPDGSSPWPCAWWRTGRRRSPISCPRNTGPWTPC